MGEPISSMSINDLNNLFDIKLQNIATKNDLSELRQDLLVVQKENQDLKATVKELGDKCLFLQNEIEQMKIATNDCNLIFQMPKSNANQQIEIVNICKNLANSQNIIAAEQIHQLSNSNNNNKTSTFLAKFSSKNCAFQVLKQSKNLKGTGISINRDYPLAVRQRRGKLLQLRKHLRACNTKTKVLLRDDNLLVDDISVRWDEKSGFVSEQEKGLQTITETHKLGEDFFLKLYSEINQHFTTGKNVIQQQKRKQMPKLSYGEMSNERGASCSYQPIGGAGGERGDCANDVNRVMQNLNSN